MQIDQILQPLDNIDALGGSCSWLDVVRARDEVRRRFEAGLSTDAEPVAWRGVGSDGVSDVTQRLDIADQWRADGIEVTPLYAEPVKTAPAVAVKPLEWKKVALGTLDWNWLEVETASTAFGAYSLQRHNTGHLRVMFGGKVVNFFEPEKYTDARAAAQADYETRIRSALSAQVQDVAKFEYRLKTPEGLEYARLNAESDEEAHQINLKNFAGRLLVEKRIVPEWETVEQLPASKHGDAE